MDEVAGFTDIGAWSTEHGRQSIGQEHGTRDMEDGAWGWSMGHGAWNTEYGFQKTLHQRGVQGMGKDSRYA